MKKKYVYTGIDGIHWPDAEIGDDLYYSIDLNDWLESEGDTLDSVSWILPDEVSSSNSYVANNITYIKLSTDTIGTYKIVCTITSTDVSRSQVNKVEMLLKVF